MAPRPVLQFKITLQGIEPPVWRRIQISDLCNFWDLHVAIQDSMGWLDCHLHQFEMNHSIAKGKEYLGIPDEDWSVGDIETLAGWEYQVRDYLVINKQFTYEYDFGDGWIHLIEYEGEQKKQPGEKYPLCLDGKRACPPEDVGGIPGYEEFVEAIKNPKHPEHEEFLQWVGGKFNPNIFDAKKIKFDSPKKRWDQSFKNNTAL